MATGTQWAVALAAAFLALASAAGLGRALRRAEARVSHQLPTPEAWRENPPPSSPTLVTQGRAVFLASCAHCHGADATGDEGPDLHGVSVSDRYLARIITHGIKGEMPAFSKKLGRDEIGAVTAYLRSLPDDAER